MKKIFLAGYVLALCAVVAFSGFGGENKKAVEGTPIGQGLFVKKTDAGKYQLCDSTGFSQSLDDYDSISDNAFFIEARNSSGITIHGNDGRIVTSCDSFSIHRYYPISSGEKEVRYLETVTDSVYRAFGLDDLKPRSVTEGFKGGIWPTSGKYSITKNGELYQLDEIGKDEPLVSECMEMHLINVKGEKEIVLLIRADEFLGYCKLDGEGIRQLSRAQFNTAKKRGKVLWTAEDGKISAIEKDAL